MAWFDPRAFGRSARSPRGKLFVLGASVATVVALSGVVTGGFAQTPSIFAAAKKQGYVPVCTQRTGPEPSKGDLNVRLKAACAKGQSALKLATWPVEGKQGPQGPQGPPGPPGDGSADQYGVANVYVSRGGGAPSRFRDLRGHARLAGRNEHGRELPFLVLGRSVAVQDLDRGRRPLERIW